jgi:hypothetical protein
MDKQRTVFYTLIVGFTLMIFPIPRFFFWDGVFEKVELVFRYFGFFIFILCCFILLLDFFRIMVNFLKQEIKKL